MAGITLPYQLFLSFALGEAAAPAIVPFAQSLQNEAWAAHAVRPPDVYQLAAGVAQGQVAEGQARSWANQQGIGDDAFTALVNVANVGMPLGTAFEAWRRGLLSQAAFETQLHRLAIEPQWWDAIEGLHNELLSSQELAMAQQQGFVDAARANEEGALQGVTAERQQLRFDMAGLPPGIGEALTMLRRGIIGDAEFAQIVREGHTKIKYTDELRQLERVLLSPSVAVEAHLKGHISAQEMHARGADWGYTPADMDLWYQAEGRPATVHQIHIGYARGGSLPGAANEREAVGIAVKQSNIRPEYEDLLYAGRYTLPTPFVMRTLTQSGVWTEQKAATRLEQAGWIPQDAAEAAAAWAGSSGGTTADPHVDKAQTRLWTTMQTSYIAGEVHAADLAPGFQALGIPAAAQTTIRSLWDHTRDLERKQLTPTQIKKAVSEGVTNPATGQPWTHNDAVARLISMGYSAADAATFLAL